VELVVEEYGTGGLVHLEEPHDRRLVMASGLIGLEGEVEDTILGGGHELVVDAGIGQRPRRGIRTWHHVVNVRAKPKLSAQGEEEGQPASVVGVLQLEGDWYVGLDRDGGVG
jgi:hypothetical protein